MQKKKIVLLRTVNCSDWKTWKLRKGKIKKWKIEKIMNFVEYNTHLSKLIEHTGWNNNEDIYLNNQRCKIYSLFIYLVLLESN